MRPVVEQSFRHRYGPQLRRHETSDPHPMTGVVQTVELALVPGFVAGRVEALGVAVTRVTTVNWSS